MIGREVHLTAHLKGRQPGPEHFRIVEAEAPDPGPGQVLVRNRLLAMRSSMRMLMTGGDLPMPAYEPGTAMWGPAIGTIVGSGDMVAHRHGWREYAVVDRGELREVDPAIPAVAHLAQADVAYVGLVRIADLASGDTVFVSSAAGSVGAMAAQIARLKGAGRVVGSAGTPEKVSWLKSELGLDAAFDYHDGPVTDLLREAAPDGIDVYFDNVGGEQLAAALEIARPGARMALCGGLAVRGPAAVDTITVIAKQITLRGFVAGAHREAATELQEWLRDGTLVVPATRYQGLDEAPRALLGLLNGEHIGNVVVEL